METPIWNHPLEIRLGDANRQTTLIRSTQEAARTLLEDWPTRRGDAYKAAIISCTRTLRGNGSPATARKSVMDAAREAGIPIVRPEPLDIEHFEVEIAQICLELAREMTVNG